MAVESAGTYANHLHLMPDKQQMSWVSAFESLLVSPIHPVHNSTLLMLNNAKLLWWHKAKLFEKTNRPSQHSTMGQPRRSAFDPDKHRWCYPQSQCELLMMYRRCSSTSPSNTSSSNTLLSTSYLKHSCHCSDNVRQITGKTSCS